MFTASSFEKKWRCKTRHLMIKWGKKIRFRHYFPPGIFERLIIDLRFARYESWYAMWRRNEDFRHVNFIKFYKNLVFKLSYCMVVLPILVARVVDIRWKNIYFLSIRMVLKKSLWRQEEKNRTFVEKSKCCKTFAEERRREGNCEFYKQSVILRERDTLQ